MMMAMRTTISRAGFLAATVVASVTLPTAVQAGEGASQVVSLRDYQNFKRASDWHGLKCKVESWTSLEADWDGEDGVAPTAAMTKSALEFLAALEACAAPKPKATVAGDGEISFEWSKGAGYASVSFTDDGHLIGYVKETGTVSPLRIDEPYTADVSKPLLERIIAFA